MCALIIGLLVAIGVLEPAAAEQPQRELPVSIARIRAALEKADAPVLALPERHADFRVDIREHQVSRDILGLLDFKSGPIPPGGLYAFEQRQRLGQAWSSQPAISVDLLSIAHAVSSAIGNARRASAERAARKEVQQALAEFCAIYDCAPD